jgi:hypothetical protein
MRKRQTDAEATDRCEKPRQPESRRGLDKAISEGEVYGGYKVKGIMGRRVYGLGGEGGPAGGLELGVAPAGGDEDGRALADEGGPGRRGAGRREYGLHGRECSDGGARGGLLGAGRTEGLREEARRVRARVVANEREAGAEGGLSDRLQNG